MCICVYCNGSGAGQQRSQSTMLDINFYNFSNNEEGCTVKEELCNSKEK